MHCMSFHLKSEQVSSHLQLKKNISPVTSYFNTASWLMTQLVCSYISTTILLQSWQEFISYLPSEQSQESTRCCIVITFSSVVCWMTYCDVSRGNCEFNFTHHSTLPSTVGFQMNIVNVRIKRSFWIPHSIMHTLSALAFKACTILRCLEESSCIHYLFSLHIHSNI